MRAPLLALAAFALCSFTAAAVADVLDPPSITVVSTARTSVTLKVVAGAKGLPGGFSVWWMKQSDYATAGWPSSYDYRLNGCDFTGTATLNTFDGSAYVLAPGQEVQIQMGDVFDETGLYASYLGELAEGTSFVFRAYALASPNSSESSFGPLLSSATNTRGPSDCTLTQGFWKNHPETWARVSGLFLGSVFYTNSQLLQIFNTPANGNGLISLAHQLIAAKLNGLLGATPPPAVQTAINQADALIGSFVVPPVGSGVLDPSQTDALTQTLDDYNNGRLSPDHCPDTGGIVGAQRSTWGQVKSLYR